MEVVEQDEAPKVTTPTVPPAPCVSFGVEQQLGEELDKHTSTQPKEKLAPKNPYLNAAQRNITETFEHILNRGDSMKKKHELFITVKLMVPKVIKGNKHFGNPTSCLWLALKDFYKVGKKFAHKSMRIYAYEKMSDTESDALSKPKDIPVQISKLQTYRNGLAPKQKGGDLYCKLRIGYDSDPHDFLTNLMLEWKAHGGFMKKEGFQQAALPGKLGYHHLHHQGI